jgi:hypothetical protein
MSNEIEMKEEWRACNLCYGYNISNHGRIKRVKTGPGTYIGRYLTAYIGTGGYMQVNLSINRKVTHQMIHTLVAKAFIGERPKGYQINHKDGNKQNNCVYNLEYCTPKENQRHAVRNGLFPVGERHGNSKLTELDVLEIRKLFEFEKSDRLIGKLFNVGHNCIHSLRLGNTWSWLNERITHKR